MLKMHKDFTLELDKEAFKELMDLLKDEPDMLESMLEDEETRLENIEFSK